MIYRCYEEKRAGFDGEAIDLWKNLSAHVGVQSLESVRVFNRYDVQGIDEETYCAAKNTIFCEPQSDICYDECLPEMALPFRLLAVEALPGQYDQRSDSCAQCIQIITHKERPVVRAARVYVLCGSVTDADYETIKHRLINPVEAREASLAMPYTLTEPYDIPADINLVEGFLALNADGLEALRKDYRLAMDIEDLKHMQVYFRSENRSPSETELRVLDTYWSDHCRHTTFLTHIDSVQIEDPLVQQAYTDYLRVREEIYGEQSNNRPVTFMDIATCAVKLLKKRGQLKNLDESDEINACSIKISADVDGKPEDYLLMFKNETHNHPTEIEPFGGAATCLGGAIRDPLSGRTYVYQAMRVTGAGDPRTPIKETIPGKLPQRQITTTAAAGYSSYGNQIGLSTGLVHEFYHEGYVAKRLEIGAVVGAAPARNIVRETPMAGDVVILLGGRTGRDGCGGATGSSKSHNSESLMSCGAEVQKGNPPEERKIQRLFRKSVVTHMIKRCNDFGAGGVCVAVGELADGLRINLDCVPKKYDGLNGTELAISESQERMAVVVASGDAEAFIAEAAKENIEASVVAEVLAEPRLQMVWRGKTIVDLSRAFLDTNGASKHARAAVSRYLPSKAKPVTKADAAQELKELAGSLNVCSQRGLVEQFDSTIGAASVLVPYGGKTQRCEAQVMAAKLPVKGETDTCSVMAFGFDPDLTAQNPFLGASAAVLESVAKLVAVGCDIDSVYLTLQEYFLRLGDDPTRWGQPLSALLGAFSAQCALSIAAIGGKDSMSGSYMDKDVPPTLVSFAIAPSKASGVISQETKAAGNPVYLFCAENKPDGAYDYAAIKALWRSFHELCARGMVQSARAVSMGAPISELLKGALGNNIGFRADEKADCSLFYNKNYGGIVAELTKDSPQTPGGTRLGYTIAEPILDLWGEKIALSELAERLEGTLEDIFPTRASSSTSVQPLNKYERCQVREPVRNARARTLAVCPLAVIPVFPGTNCEYDTARAIEQAGGQAEIVVIRNLSPSMLSESLEALQKAIRRANMLVLPGGFSGGDEPDGSGKFIAAFFRNAQLVESVHDLLENRDGLALGICNGFQALVKLGLLPYGKIRKMDERCPTLTFNTIGRHQSKYVCTRVASVQSPWLSLCNEGELHSVPVSHGEGRFVAPEAVLKVLAENGQIAFEYVSPDGKPSMDIDYNPNGSMLAIEGVMSANGRVLGKMAHTERVGNNVAKNIPGNKEQRIFEAGVRYFL